MTWITAQTSNLLFGRCKMDLEIFGESIKFWITIIVGSIVKLCLGERQTLKVGAAGVLAGGIVAFYGHDWAIIHIGFFDSNDEPLVVILLTLTGEHMVRSIVAMTPEKIFKIIRSRFK